MSAADDIRFCPNFATGKVEITHLPTGASVSLSAEETIEFATQLMDFRNYPGTRTRVIRLDPAALRKAATIRAHARNQ
jgi:hypothetical protein